MDTETRGRIRKISNPSDFVYNIELSFGMYKEGMKDTIVTKLDKIDRVQLSNLYNHLIDTWDYQSPPVYGKIRAKADELGIFMGKKGNFSYVLVCRKCKRIRTLDAYKCPECGQINNHFVARGKLVPGNVIYDGEE